MKAALFRLVRVLVAQAIAFAIAETTGINIPILNISLGALINATAKYIRDKFKLEWLPV